MAFGQTEILDGDSLNNAALWVFVEERHSRFA
jgi:hypothetical protein